MRVSFIKNVIDTNLPFCFEKGLMLQDSKQPFCNADLLLSLIPINTPQNYALAMDPVCYIKQPPHLKREAHGRDVPQCYAQLKQCVMEKACPWQMTYLQLNYKLPFCVSS